MSNSKYRPPSKPSNSSWSLPPANELLKIAGCSLIPLGVMFAGRMYYEKHGTASGILYESYSKPCWAISNEYVVKYADYATVAPMGYALYLVTKNGLDSTDVRNAVGMFGITMATAFLWNVAFTTKDIKCWFGASAAIAGTAGATWYLFGQVDQVAGYLTAPFAAWALFTTTVMAGMWYKNRPPSMEINKK